METEQRADGTLSDTPLPALLTAIAGDASTGVLRIGDGSEVWFSGGRTYLATTPSSPELAKVLVDAEVGAEAELAPLLAEGSDGDQASVLDRLAADHPDAEGALARVVHEHTLNSLFELLVPSDASYRFDPDESHPLGDRFAQDTGELVAKAEQRLEIWRRIAARIPSTGAVFTLARSLPDQLDQRLVTADEWRFLSLLDGRNTVADVIQETGESAFRVCSSLYRLLVENLVEEAQPANA